MTLQILNKASFCKKFLDPISKISDLAIIKISKDFISCLCKETETAVFIYAETRDVFYDGEDRELHVKDLKRFIKILNSIPSDKIDLKINSNNIEYKSPTIKFKFHLIDEGIIIPPKFSVNNIEASKFSTFFKMSVVTYDEMLKCSSFIVDTDKIYISTNSGLVLGELNDVKKDNVDTFSQKLADFYDGEDIESPIPFSVQLFRNISTLKVQEMDIRLNIERRIIAISIDDNNYSLKYYATGLVA